MPMENSDQDGMGASTRIVLVYSVLKATTPATHSEGLMVTDPLTIQSLFAVQNARIVTELKIVQVDIR